MLSRFRPRLTFANVVSVVALFVALSAGAYAAVHLPKNSVGTKQLKNRAVTTRKLKNGSVTLPKLGNGSVAMPKLGPGVVSRLGQKAHRFWVDTNVGIPAGKVFDAPDFKIVVRPSTPYSPFDYCYLDVIKKNTAASVSVNGSDTTGPPNGTANSSYLHSTLLTSSGETAAVGAASTGPGGGDSDTATSFVQSYGAGDTAHTYMVSASLFLFQNNGKCAAYGVVVPAS